MTEKKIFMSACKDCKSISEVIRQTGFCRGKLLKMEAEYGVFMTRGSEKQPEITKEKLLSICNKAGSIVDIVVATDRSYTWVRKQLRIYGIKFVSKKRQTNRYDYDAVYKIYLDNNRNGAKTARQAGCSKSVVYRAIAERERKNAGT